MKKLLKYIGNGLKLYIKTINTTVIIYILLIYAINWLSLSYKYGFFMDQVETITKIAITFMIIHFVLYYALYFISRYTNMYKVKSKRETDINVDKLCYVASPVKKYVTLSEQVTIDRVTSYASKLCKAVKDAGYIPISAPILFISTYDELTEREEAFKAGIVLLNQCKAFAYREADLKVSEGIKEELKYAQTLGLEIITID